MSEAIHHHSDNLCVKIPVCPNLLNKLWSLIYDGGRNHEFGEHSAQLVRAPKNIVGKGLGGGQSRDLKASIRTRRRGRTGTNRRVGRRRGRKFAMRVGLVPLGRHRGVRELVYLLRGVRRRRRVAAQDRGQGWDYYGRDGTC